MGERRPNDVAIAGAGWMAAIHASIVPTLGGRVVAVASRTPERAGRLAEQTGGRVVTYEDLPAGADVVIVATPPQRHAVDALRAMAAGAVAVVEKPLCTTLADADRLVRVADLGGSLLYADNLLFADATSTALTEIAGLGPLTHLTARAMQPRPSRGDVTLPGWGGGVLFDLGVHPVALVLRAAGNASPVSVSATFETTDLEVEDQASVVIEFDTGLRAGIEVSWREATPIWDLQAASSDGVVWFELLPDLSLERSGEPVALPTPPEAEYPPQFEEFGYVSELRSALAAAAGTPDTISDARFGRQVLEIVCAAAVAAASDAACPLPYGGDRTRTPAQLWRPEDLPTT